MKLKFYTLVCVLLAFQAVSEAQHHGSITIRNQGGYMARFSIVFNLDNQWTTYSSGYFPVAQSRTLELPVGSLNARLYVQNLIFFGVWREVISMDLKTGNERENVCITVSGTTLHPRWNRC